MASSIAKSILIGLPSGGWIVPFYLAASAYLRGFEHLLRGTSSVDSSNPAFIPTPLLAQRLALPIALLRA